MTNNRNNNEDMENVFDGLTQYGGKWECINQRLLNKREVSGIKSCEVKPSDYGLSMCFLMINGKKTYIPIDKQSDLNVGDTPNPADIILKKLKNVGEPSQPLGKIILKCDVDKDDDDEVATDFNDPFGLNS